MISVDNECCGCGLCENICPKNAITLAFNDEGFRYPIVSKEKCINCSLCDSKCIVKNPSHPQENVLPSDDKKAFAAVSNDVNELLTSSSGGVATQISKYFIKNGGYVCGVVYDSSYKEAHYICSNNIDDILKMRGSKYIQAETREIYKDMVKILAKGLPVLFIGTPCLVNAALLFIPEKLRDLLYTVEIICHGPTAPKVAEQYIDSLEKKFKSKIVDFSVRDKTKGWKPIQLKASFENGNIYHTNFYSTSYGIAFKVYQRPSCYDCKFKSTIRNSDIMIGDFWGMVTDDYRYNKNGVSAVLVNSKKGYNLMNGLENITLYDATYKEILKGNKIIDHQLSKYSSRNLFSFLLKYTNLEIAAKFAGKDLKDIIRTVVPSTIRKRMRKNRSTK